MKANKHRCIPTATCAIQQPLDRRRKIHRNVNRKVPTATCAIQQPLDRHRKVLLLQYLANRAAAVPYESAYPITKRNII